MPAPLPWSTYIPVEADGSEAMQHVVANYSDDDNMMCCDPFDVVAALEEEFDAPLAFVRS